MIFKPVQGKRNAGSSMFLAVLCARQMNPEKYKFSTTEEK